VWHGSPDGGGQSAPTVHALQAPAPQTALVPQLVPSVSGVPASLHTGPAVHDSVPA